MSWHALPEDDAATSQPTFYMDSIRVMLNEVKHLYVKDPSLTLKMTKNFPRQVIIWKKLRVVAYIR